jgi:signal transduction histidine kinase
MTARELLQRTQVRLAATFAVLFTLAASTLFALLLLRLTDQIEERVHSRVMRTMDALVAIDRKFGFDELTNVVVEEAESVRDADAIFLLLDKNGHIHAGNVQSVAPFEGWKTIPRNRLPLVAQQGSPQDRFFSRWTEVSNGHLLVGGSDREIRQSRLILLHSVGWGLLITVAIGLGAGVHLARRSQQRIDQIGSTLTAVASGQLDRRIPTGGEPQDDLDLVAQKTNAMLAQLQRVVQNANQASTNIAHELKKPMSRLRETLELANQKAASPDDFHVAIDDAIVQLDSIVSTFEALLNISQLQAGARKLRFTDLNIKTVLDDVVELYAPVVEDAGGTLRVDLAVSSAPIRGDRELLVQLFANLIENSLRHCPSPVQISLSLAPSGTEFVITVADNGPGIPDTEKENVLRRFYRIEKEGAGDGHGLGLSVVVAIAELHSARVELAGNNPGLRVIVRMPSAQPRRGQVASSQKK